MLDPDLLGEGGLVGADVGLIPELGSDTEVLAAAHEGVGFAGFDGAGDGFFGEVGVFALGLANESANRIGQLARS